MTKVQIPSVSKFRQSLFGAYKTNCSFLLFHQFVYLLFFFCSYEYRRKVISFPLPSYSTVCQHLQSIKFYPGLLYVILDWITIKMSHHSASDRY